ncbi:LacI family DNA-binding transcriptional regulator [Microbacterium marinilacus]|uniref:Substrate-binding domain-containing protein n=1 Tax=Microbacterium marinilacus TaxID=415209 RepID=A0ABP7B818_9MICO|nr:LacI family DNA-binding transcriptional regulator [Microbacterium marinilacus]MBY0687389.1 LacI family transcriptional regulator [Microbacterium marinilacus]
MERRRDRSPTIVDVAREAGVSKSLVSLAIRGEAGVGEASRERILDAARRLGYRSNSWARSLARGRSQLVGVLVNDLRSGYYVDVVRGIEDAAQRADLRVVLGEGRRDPAITGARIAHLQQLGVDGLVVISGRVDPQTLAQAAALCPVVVVGRPPEVPVAAAQVSNDDRAGARLAIRHLVALGHRRIAHLTDSTRPAASDRRDAVLATLEEFGLGTRGRVVSADGAGRLAAAVAARDPDAPTAVFARNDRTAVRLLGAAIDAGLRVPEDLSLIGYDNTDVAGIVRPTLTSVDQPRLAMGELAMELLTELSAGAAPRREVVRPELVVRASTAPAPGWSSPGARPD